MCSLTHTHTQSYITSICMSPVGVHVCTAYACTHSANGRTDVRSRRTSHICLCREACTPRQADLIIRIAQNGRAPSSFPQRDRGKWPSLYPCVSFLTHNFSPYRLL